MDNNPRVLPLADQLQLKLLAQEIKTQMWRHDCHEAHALNHAKEAAHAKREVQQLTTALEELKTKVALHASGDERSGVVSDDFEHLLFTAQDKVD